MLSRRAISANERTLPEANSSNHPLERATALSSAGFGGTPLDQWKARFREAQQVANTIVIDVDSPGGLVPGTDELSSEIFAARKQTRVIAVVNSLCASAAYWIASGASEVICTPSGECGSIGVFATHTDFSKMEKAMGVKTTLISAGKYKVEGNEYEPLNDEARTAMQARVDDYYQMFTKAVARNRGVDQATVIDSFGEGRVVGAKKAVNLGMADRIETFAETVARVQRGGNSPTAHSIAPARLSVVRSADTAPAVVLSIRGCAVPYNTMGNAKRAAPEDRAPFPWLKRLYRQGCFNASLADRDTVTLVAAHEDDRILASTSNGTLRLRDCDDGLYFSASLDLDDEDGALIARLIARDGSLPCSVRADYGVCDFEYFERPGQTPVQAVTRAALRHIAILIDEPAAFEGAGCWRG